MQTTEHIICIHDNIFILSFKLDTLNYILHLYIIHIELKNTLNYKNNA